MAQQTVQSKLVGGKGLRKVFKRLLPRKILDIGRDVYGTAVTRVRMGSVLKTLTSVNVEIGSGARRGEKGWLTVDMSLESDFYWDLRRGLPFPENSVSTLYSSHVLEHFSHREILRLLADCFRVLKPGGELSACVPDASVYLDGYAVPSRFDRTHMSYAPAVYSDQRMDIVNYIAYMDGQHKYMFDRENLMHVLRESGFQNVRLREFNQSVDLAERVHESIYVSCWKS